LIRKASLKDVKKIHALISEQAKGGHLLARAIADLYSQIRDFSVAVDEDTGEIVGDTIGPCTVEVAEYSTKNTGTTKPIIIDHVNVQATQMNSQNHPVQVYEYRIDPNNQPIDTGIITPKGLKRIDELKAEPLEIKRPEKWDGKWRIVIFDVPNKRKSERDIFRHKITKIGLQPIQESVYVTGSAGHRKIIAVK